MGKSLGNILEPKVLLQAYGADAVRFFFLKEVVFGQARSPPLDQASLPSINLSSAHLLPRLCVVLLPADLCDS